MGVVHVGAKIIHLVNGVGTCVSYLPLSGGKRKLLKFL